MNWFDKLADAVTSLTVLAVASLTAGVGWLIRRVFTDSQKIEALKVSLTQMEDRMDARMDDLREDMRQLIGLVAGGRK